MSRFSQFHYTNGPNSGPGGLLGRIIAAIIGIIVLGVAVFVGAIFIAAIIGLVLVGALVFSLRLWWLRRQMARYQAEHGDLEGEYTVVETEVREIERTTRNEQDR